MNKILLAFATLIVLAACSQKPTATPKITTAEEFGKLFGMATTMGEDVSGSRGGKVRLREDVFWVARRKSEAAGGCFWVARRRRKQISGRFLLEYASNWIIFCTFAAATRLIW